MRYFSHIGSDLIFFAGDATKGYWLINGCFFESPCFTETDGESFVANKIYIESTNPPAWVTELVKEKL